MKDLYEVEVILSKREREFKFLSQPVLDMQLENFKVRSNFVGFNRLVNKQLNQQENEFIRSVYQRYYPLAVYDFKNSAKEDYSFFPYSAYLVYKVAYNSNCVFSYYYDNYTYTGGAHGSTLRKAQTYSVYPAKKLSLWHFFGGQEQGKPIILKQILSQAKQNLQQNEGIYFDNYESLIKNNFNPENFYLSQQGLVVFFNQYEIAPYSTGIVEFTIAYSHLPCPPKCN